MKPERLQKVLSAITAQWGIKLLALVLAAIVFYTVRDTIGHATDATETVEREIPHMRVVAAMLPEGAGTIRITPPAVSLNISGRSDELRRLDVGTVMVFVDARGIAPGTSSELPLQVYLPPGVSVDTATAAPPKVRLSLIEP